MELDGNNLLIIYRYSMITMVLKWIYNSLTEVATHTNYVDTNYLRVMVR